MSPIGSSALMGHLGADHPLSPRAALAQLHPLVKGVLHYQPAALWDSDTARLPWRMQTYRRRARDFAQQCLAPLALSVDAEPHVGQGPSARRCVRCSWRLGDKAGSRICCPRL